MNNLGGMVFIVFGVALGYWVMTGKAANFLHAVNTGSSSSQTTQPNQPWWQVTPPPGSLFQFLGNQSTPTTGPPMNNVSQNVPSNWVSI